jgi:hypothetical protein
MCVVCKIEAESTLLLDTPRIYHIIKKLFFFSLFCQGQEIGPEWRVRQAEQQLSAHAVRPLHHAGHLGTWGSVTSLLVPAQLPRAAP